MALRPTFLLFALLDIKFVCLVVKIWLKLNDTHYVVEFGQFISL